MFVYSFYSGESRLDLKKGLPDVMHVRSQADHRGDVSCRQGQLLGNRGREMTAQGQLAQFGLAVKC